MAQSESRFGFGQLAGSVGVALLGLGVTQPWIKLDLEGAGELARVSQDLAPQRAGEILFVWSNTDPAARMTGSPQFGALLRSLGIYPTGWEQQQWIAIGVIIAAVLALIGVVRSLFAKTAWSARAYAPLLALSGLGALALAGVELWVLSPEPQAAMKPGTGLWLIAAGGVALLLGALTLGNNRRRPWVDDFETQAPAKQFDNTEHLAYSHGAWVPRNSEDGR